MKLQKIIELTGTITLKTGLHIGSGDTEMKIGGTDNPVIKHPYTLEPYIPGSSLKGKVRALLEMRSGLIAYTEGRPLSASLLKRKDLSEDQKVECEKILKLFGVSGADIEEEDGLGPSRASFSDCPLDDNWKKEILENNLSFTEVKAENFINRIKVTAESPRFIERVPAGAKFRFQITIRCLNKGEEKLEDFLLEGLKLLEMDNLGGSGSRGYGRIKLEFDDSVLNEKFEKIMPF